MTTEGKGDRPSVLYRPALILDGNQWRALYGDTPAEAMADFDKNWLSYRPFGNVGRTADAAVKAVLSEREACVKLTCDYAEKNRDSLCRGKKWSLTKRLASMLRARSNNDEK